MSRYTSLSECDDLIVAATAAEMIFILSERQDYSGMSVQRRKDCQIFIEAAVHMVIECAPEFIRPANIGGDLVQMCLSLRREGPWGVH